MRLMAAALVVCCATVYSRAVVVVHDLHHMAAVCSRDPAQMKPTSVTVVCCAPDCSRAGGGRM